MNWRSTGKPTSRVIMFSRDGSGAPALNLEGSLAGVVCLAPILPFSLEAAFRRAPRRRPSRPKA